MKYILIGTSLVLGVGLVVHDAVGAEPNAKTRSVITDGTGDQSERECDQSESGFTTESRVSVQRLIGLRVTNPLNEEIGEVDDLILDRCGRVVIMVVRVGGFMGVGGSYVRIFPAKVRIRLRERPWGLTVTVRETREHILRNQGTLSQGE